MKPSTAGAAFLAAAAHPTSSFVLFERDRPRHADGLRSRVLHDARSASCNSFGREGENKQAALYHSTYGKRGVFEAILPFFGDSPASLGPHPLQAGSVSQVNTQDTDPYASLQSFADGRVDNFFFDVGIPDLADLDLSHLPSFLQFVRSPQTESASHRDREEMDPFASPQFAADGSVNNVFFDVISPASADLKLSPLPSSLALIHSLQARSVSQVYGEDWGSYGSRQALADAGVGDFYFNVFIRALADLELSPLSSFLVIDSFQNKTTEPSSVSRLREKAVVPTDVMSVEGPLQKYFMSSPDLEVQGCCQGARRYTNFLASFQDIAHNNTGRFTSDAVTLIYADKKFMPLLESLTCDLIFGAKSFFQDVEGGVELNTQFGTLCASALNDFITDIMISFKGSKLMSLPSSLACISHLQFESTTQASYTSSDNYPGTSSSTVSLTTAMSMEQRTTAPQATLTTTEYFRLLFSPLVANISTNTNNELSSHQKSMTFISFLQTKCIPTVSDFYNITLPKSNKMKVHNTSQPMVEDYNTVPPLSQPFNQDKSRITLVLLLLSVVSIVVVRASCLSWKIKGISSCSHKFNRKLKYMYVFLATSLMDVMVIQADSHGPHEILQDESAVIGRELLTKEEINVSFPKFTQESKQKLASHTKLGESDVQHPMSIVDPARDLTHRDHDTFTRKITSTVMHGTVISDTLHVTAADSPFLVAGYLDIKAGGTLVIHAGSTVIFETASSGIYINSGGQLLITGTIDNRVTLKAHDDEDSWGGIVFGVGSAPALFNDIMNYVSGSVMQYVDIIRAGFSMRGSSIGLLLHEGVVPYLLGVDMIDCGGSSGSAISIRDFDAFAVFRNVRILQSSETKNFYPRNGLYIDGNNDNGGKVILENLALEVNYGLFIDSVDYVSITRSFFAGELYISSIRKKINIAQNSIENGIELRYLTASSPSFVVDNSLKGPLLLLHFGYYSSDSEPNITIAGNIIKDSTEGGIYISNKRGYVAVMNNTVRDCSTSSSVIELRSDLISSVSYSASLVFRNNSIFNCKGLYILRIIGSPYSNHDIFVENFASHNTATNSFLFVEDYPWSNFSLNVFENITAPISVKIDMLSSYDKPMVPLPQNYWGLFQTDIIGPRNTVADGFVIASQPIVDFVSVLSASSIESDAIKVQVPGLFQSDGSLGGVISKDESFVLFNTNFTANSSILVLGVLKLGPNVTIKFADGCSIVVKEGGELSLDGVELNAQTSNGWVGIVLEHSDKAEIAISNSRISGASNGILVKSTGDISIHHSTFRDITSNAIHIQTSAADLSITLSNIFIDRPGRNAIYAQDFQGYLSISSSKITNTAGYSVYVNPDFYLSNQNSEILLENNEFSSSAVYINKYYKVTMTLNQLTCSSQGKDCVYIVNGYETVIEDNVVSGVVRPSYYQLLEIRSYTSSATSFSLQRNTFSNWETYGVAVYVDVGQNSGGSGSIALQDNRFYNISAGTIVNLYFRSAANPVNIANTFASNLKTTSSSCPSSLCISSWPSTCGSGPCTLNGNIFDFPAPEGQYHIYVSVNFDSVPQLDASLSYFGTMNESNLTDVIFDGTDDPECSIIKYLPYLLSHDPDGGKSSNMTSLGFLRSGSILSGLLSQGDSVILNKAGSPYKSEGSLIIDGYLEISPNVTIQMDEGASLLVRKGSLKAVGTSQQPISLEKLSESEWAGLTIDRKIGVASGFQLLLAYNDVKSYSMGQELFRSLFELSQSKTLVRYCPGCTSSHQIIFYKRISATTNFDVYDSLTCNFTSDNNVLNSDFELYHSMEDFLSGTNKWTYCQHLAGHGFPGRCGPSHEVFNQSSTFQPTCPISVSYQDEVYWFMYDESLTGENYQPEWIPSEILSNLPFFFTFIKDIALQHIVISGAGADSEYSLIIERPSTVPFKSLSIFDCMGNGLKVNKGTYIFEDLTIKSDTSSYGNGIYIGSHSHVSINNYLISTKHSGNAVYVDEYSSLSLSNGKIIPKSNYQHAIYGGNYVDTIKVENFSYKHDSVGVQYRNVLYSYYLQNILSFKNSTIDCSSMRYYCFDLEGLSTSSILIQNVSVVGNGGAFDGFFRNRGWWYTETVETVVFEGNSLFGGRSYSDAVSFSSNSIVLRNNIISHVKADSSIIKLQGNSIHFKENKLMIVEGNAAVEISDFDYLDLTRNSFLDPTVKYYVKTESQYETESNAVATIGTNYWSTTSFDELNKATYDSFYDSNLVSIEYESLYIDEHMTQTILAPPLQPILDVERKTLAGILSSGVIVVVPSGLYYAESSIILRHPEAQLVLQPGVRIMFAEQASIRVDYGVLIVAGTSDDPVQLSPTKNFTSEYGDKTIPNSTVFGGIFFGRNSNGTLVGGNQYISGSILSGLVMDFGGYEATAVSFSCNGNTAGVYLDTVSVVLKDVTIRGDWSRYGDGIYICKPDSDVLLDKVTVQDVGRHGIYIINSDERVSLLNVEVHGCYLNGIRIAYVDYTTISGSRIHDNRGDQVYVHDYGGSIFIMDSCTISNSNGRGVNVDYTDICSVTSTNFTQVKRPLYIESSVVNVALSRFNENVCLGSRWNNCAVIELSARGLINFHANLVEDNSATHQILAIRKNDYARNFKVDVIGNIFRDNSIPASTSGSSAVLVMMGSFLSADDTSQHDSKIFDIHSNEFHNPFSLYEMSTAQIDANSSFKINATNNYFTVSSEANASASVIDDRLFDDDEAESPEILFKPYSTKNMTRFCPLNCPENAICVFPGVCICKDGWSGSSCDILTCTTLGFCSPSPSPRPISSKTMKAAKTLRPSADLRTVSPIQ